jgi:hypothetical protein
VSREPLHKRATAGLCERCLQPFPCLEARFHDCCSDLYRETGRRSKEKTGKAYWAKRFAQQIALRGAVEVARSQLRRPDPPDGFQKMIDVGLEEILLEADVLRRPWRTLFSPTELDTACRRLRTAGLAHLIPSDLTDRNQIS